MARFEIPDGWTVQAFCFALDCTPEQAACVRRQFGGRRYARNWAVRTLKEDLDRAAINLARYEPPATGDSALGPVRAAVKRGADPKTRRRRAGGDETRKGPSQKAGKQPRDGVPMSNSL